jgi:uncharacterized protein (TIGR02466 family)
MNSQIENSELIVEQFFSSAVFRMHRPDFLHTIRPLFNEYVDSVRGEIVDKKEYKIYPAIMTRNMHQDERLDAFVAFIGNLSWTILDGQGYNMDMYYTKIQDMWGQNHQQASGMDHHIHGVGSVLSGFYFIDVPETSSQVTFHDPRSAKIYSGLPERNINNLTPACNMINFTPKAGDLIIANSWLPHSFLRNFNTSAFNFLHFNIEVVPNTNMDIKNNDPIIV